MTVEKVYTEQEKAMIEALAKIKELCTPGQQLYHSQCIDIICDCWNISNDAIKKVVG